MKVASTDTKHPDHSFRSLTKEMPPLDIDEPPPLEDRMKVLQKLSVGEPSKPVLGLPLARLIPQDIHSLLDYSNGLLLGSCAMMTNDPRAKIASIVLASAAVGVAAVTDYRLSVAKLVPIEAHEVIDHVWSLSAIAAPFVLGYWKTSPKIAIAHVMSGVGTIIGSLFTDYRAFSRRSKAGTRKAARKSKRASR